MVWGGVSFLAKSLPHIFRGRVTGVAYRDEVLQPIVASFIKNDPRIQMFQQDNARAHMARVSMTFLQNNNVNVLRWPALLPGYVADRTCVGFAWSEIK